LVQATRSITISLSVGAFILLALFVVVVLGSEKTTPAALLLVPSRAHSAGEKSTYHREIEASFYLPKVNRRKAVVVVVVNKKEQQQK
jgi:hypothetical protein